MRRKDQIAGRFFLVGCERSGTTLLQAMLARHSRVFSFPESHFFCRAVPRRRRYRVVGLANWRRCRQVLQQLVEVLGYRDVEHLIPRHSPFLGAQVRAFSRIVDRAALGQGKDMWVEKTPHHLYQIPAIQRKIPGARFIHIIRDGRDVSASIQDASNRDPDYWGTWTLDAMVETWNQAVATSLSYLGEAVHILVSYEALLEHPAAELTRICEFLGVDFETQMVDHREAAESVLGWMGNRPWMESVYQPVHDTRLKKYSIVFSQEQQNYIAGRLLWGGSVRAMLDPLATQVPASSA